MQVEQRPLLAPIQVETAVLHLLQLLLARQLPPLQVEAADHRSVQEPQCIHHHLVTQVVVVVLGPVLTPQDQRVQAVLVSKVEMRDLMEMTQTFKPVVAEAVQLARDQTGRPPKAVPAVREQVHQ